MMMISSCENPLRLKIIQRRHALVFKKDSEKPPLNLCSEESKEGELMETMTKKSLLFKLDSTVNVQNNLYPSNKHTGLTMFYDHDSKEEGKNQAYFDPKTQKDENSGIVLIDYFKRTMDTDSEMSTITPPKELFCESKEIEKEEQVPIKTKTILPFDLNFPENAQQNMTSLYPPKKRLCLEMFHDHHHHHDDEKIKPKTQKGEKSVNALFDYIKEIMDKDTGMRLIIQKKLEKTDTEGQQARLAIPRKCILNNFLSESEEKDLRSTKMEVRVIGSSTLQERVMLLSRWNYHNKGNKSEPGFKYVVNGGWNQLRAENGFQKDEVIQVWSFRQKGRLCLGIAGLGKVKKASLSPPPPLPPIPTWGRTQPRTPRVEFQ